MVLYVKGNLIMPNNAINIFSFLFIFNVILFFSSCQRFEEDNKLSIYTAKKRVSGNWKLVKYLIDGVDSSRLFIDSAEVPCLEYEFLLKPDLDYQTKSYLDYYYLNYDGCLRNKCFSSYNLDLTAFFIKKSVLDRTNTNNTITINGMFFRYRNERFPSTINGVSFFINKLTKEELHLKLKKKSNKTLDLYFIKI